MVDDWPHDWTEVKTQCNACGDIEREMLPRPDGNTLQGECQECGSVEGFAVLTVGGEAI